MKLKVFVKKLQRGLLNNSAAKSHEEDEVRKNGVKMVKKGHFAVIAGKGEERKRFEVELEFLGDPAFVRLLQQAEEEHGFQYHGVLSVPCRPQELQTILSGGRKSGRRRSKKMVQPVTFLPFFSTTVDLPNELHYAVAKRQSFAFSWVQKNVVVYYPSTQIEAIAIGNEVFADTRNTTKFLLPAMKNFHQSLQKLKLDSTIKVSSPIALSALQSSYPSSACAFQSELIEPAFKPLLKFLRETGSYLMVNAYPFFAYESNSDVISLDYALFRENPGVVDAGNGLRYFSLFDAQIDALFAAMSALKFDDIRMVVTESSWPSKGEETEVIFNEDGLLVEKIGKEEKQNSPMREGRVKKVDCWWRRRVEKSPAIPNVKGNFVGQRSFRLLSK